MANIEKNRKLMIEQIKKVKSLLRESTEFDIWENAEKIQNQLNVDMEKKILSKLNSIFKGKEVYINGQILGKKSAQITGVVKNIKLVNDRRDIVMNLDGTEISPTSVNGVKLVKTGKEIDTSEIKNQIIYSEYYSKHDDIISSKLTSMLKGKDIDVKDSRQRLQSGKVTAVKFWKAKSGAGWYMSIYLDGKEVKLSTRNKDKVIIK